MSTFLSSVIRGTWAWIESNASTIFSAGAGTYAGAYLAFHFERRYRERKETAQRLLGGKMAQFTLMSQITLLKNLKKNYLDPRSTDPTRELTLTPVSIHTRPGSLDLEKLQFFLEDDGAEVLNRLILAEQRFGTCLGTLEQRNQSHHDAQQQISATGTVDRASLQILLDLTNALYVNVDDTIKYHEKQIDALTHYLKKRFPKARPLTIEYL